MPPQNFDPNKIRKYKWNKLTSKVKILGVFSSVLPYMVLSSDERQKRLDEFHKNYDENVLGELSSNYSARCQLEL